MSGGTPAYMAPEEASGARPSEAGDWYGIGVTLYEALTGTVPFADTPTELLLHKITIDPPAPAEWSPDVPADLSAICMGLLCRDPERRLSGPAALRQLSSRHRGTRQWTPTPCAIRDTPFVGRDGQLHVLNEAFRAVDERTAPRRCACPVRQASARAHWSGTFSARSPDHDDVVVLSGRCYENESVPYKALDGVVDDLSRHLASIPGPEVEGLLPPDVAALTRVFPVLLQVHAIAAAPADQHARQAPTRLSLRRRAFEALARAARAGGEPAAARHLHRRSAVGRRGQRRAARGTASASGRTRHAHAVVLPQRGNGRQAVPAGAARARGP